MRGGQNFRRHPKELWRTFSSLEEGVDSGRKKMTETLRDMERRELASDPVRVNVLWAYHDAAMAMDPSNGDAVTLTFDGLALERRGSTICLRVPYMDYLRTYRLWMTESL